MLKFSQLMEKMNSMPRDKAFSWDAEDTESHGEDIKESFVIEKRIFAPGHEEVRAGFKAHGRSLNKKTVDHIKHYKENQGVNHELRSTDHKAGEHWLTGHDYEHSKHLDHATSHETKGHMTVYRGLTKGHMERNKGMKPGHHFTDHGYASASFHKHVAAKFGNKEQKHIMAIHAPAGTKAHHFDHHKTENRHEDEVVFHRGTKFKVSHHEHDGEHHIVHVHVVGQHPKPIHEF